MKPAESALRPGKGKQMTENRKLGLFSSIQREYDRIDRQWLTLHYRTVLSLVGVGLLTQLVLALAFYKIMSAEVSIDFAKYATDYMLNPLLLHLVFLLFSVLAVKLPDISPVARVYMLSFSLIGVCFVFYSAHYIFYLSIIFCVPIFLTLFYSNYRLITVVTILSVTAKLISDFFVFWDVNRPRPLEDGLSIMRIAISTLMIAFIYGISMIIISVQQKKSHSAIRIEEERVEIQKQLMIDPLTGINNRLALRTMFQEIEDSVYDNYFFSMLDLDNFKALNDTLGHTKGDECLICLGDILKGHSGDNTLAFRFGGDEFGIVFRNQTREQVTWTCQVIREEFNLRMREKSMLSLSVSIGIAQYERGMFVEDLVQNADKALYRAKELKDAVSF